MTADEKKTALIRYRLGQAEEAWMTQSFCLITIEV